MKILITTARAPVALEWVKIAKKSGHIPILADTLDYPICSFYKDVEYKKIHSPRLDFENYLKDIEFLSKQVDMIIPNGEDIFYLAKVRDIIDSKIKFFIPDTNDLFNLHSKMKFFEKMNNNVKIPNSILIENKNEINFNKKTVLKPEFSRFGKNVIRDVNKKNIQNIEINKNYKWVQQDFIEGNSLCNYAICENGEVISHVVYKPKYLINNSASSYFEYTEDKRCENFIKEFAKNNNFNGQIAFDFIDDGKDLYIIECNPRTTSGLHLISKNIFIEKNGKITSIGKIEKRSYRVGFTLFLLFGLQSIKENTFKTLIFDYKKAKNVLSDLPFYGQFISMYEIFKKSKSINKTFTDTSTYDIEYDG